MNKTSNFIPTWNQNIIRFNHNPIIPDSFRMLIVGPSNCGKTVLLLKMLLTPEYLDYENLIIFSKTIDQPEFQLLMNGFNAGLKKEDIIDIFLNQDKFPKNMSMREICYTMAEQRQRTTSSITVTMSNKNQDIIPCEKLNKSKKNLIVFDDCVNLKNQDIMESYFTRGRHNKCNCIYLSQNYYDLPGRSIRGNSNFFIFFKLNQRNKSNIYTDLFSTILERSEFDYFDQHLSQNHNYIALNKDTSTVYESIID